MSRPDVSDGVAAKLLAARRALRSTEWDGTDLDHFVQVLCRLDGDRHGFGALDLAAVEAAWRIADGESWSGGVIARLKDGRRTQVDGRAGNSHWSEDDSDIHAGLLEAGQLHPEFDAHGRQTHAWDEEMARRLNQLLDRVHAAEGIVTDKTIELDGHRGLAAQKATESRRLLGQVEANERALRERREELESHLIAAPAATWAEAAEKARYVIGLYAATLGSGDTQRRTLIAAVLDDLERLANASAAG